MKCFGSYTSDAIWMESATRRRLGQARRTWNFGPRASTTSVEANARVRPNSNGGGSLKQTFGVCMNGRRDAACRGHRNGNCACDGCGDTSRPQRVTRLCAAASSKSRNTLVAVNRNGASFLAQHCKRSASKTLSGRPMWSGVQRFVGMSGILAVAWDWL
jgi:hypothetical protein